MRDLKIPEELGRLYKVYFEYRHELQPKDDVFVCICRAEQIGKIEEHYSNLWSEIVEGNLYSLDGFTLEQITPDPVLQGWESFDGVILEDIKTGERVYHEDRRGETVMKAFEPLEESVQLLKDLTIRKESKGE